MTDQQKQQITEMRKSGNSYAEISAALSMPIGTIKAYFSRNPAGKSIAPTLDIPEKTMVNRCKYCGGEIVNTPGHRQRIYCSDECQRLYWREHPDLMNHTAIIQKRCPACGMTFSDYKAHSRKYCSHACYISYRYGRTVHESE